VTGIACDLAALQAGDLFVALPNEEVSVAHLAGRAVARGAAALLVPASLDLGVPELVAADCRAAMARVAAAFYGDPSRELNVIGVTGTDGKTTTTYLIDAILRAAGQRTGFISTVAIRVGDAVERNATGFTTPESVDVQRILREMADAGATWAVLEATSQGLAVNRLDATRFRVAAVTNITPEHLDYHVTMEEYRRAKAILFLHAAASGGLAVINVDDAGAAAMLPYAEPSTVVRYSAQGRPAEVRATGIQVDADRSRFTLETVGGARADLEVPLPGSFNVTNALCAASVAVACGMPVDAIARGLASAPAVPGRMVSVDAGQPFGVIVDYAHTAGAHEQVLQYLRARYPRGRLIVMFGGMEHRVRSRRDIGAIAARLADFCVFTTNSPGFEAPERIIAHFTAGAEAIGARPDEDFVCIPDRLEAMRYALSIAGPGDCVLLAGKGHETALLGEGLSLPWDEVEIARELLTNLGHGQRVPGRRRVSRVTAPRRDERGDGGGRAPTLTALQDVFGRHARPLPPELDRSRVRTIVVTGDVMPARDVAPWIRNCGPDYPFAQIAPVLREADLTIANLEAPLIGNCPPKTHGVTFCGLPPLAEALVRAGIDVVTIENNHIGDFGPEGIAETITHLDAAGLDYASRDRLLIREVRGFRIGVLAFNGVGGRFDREGMVRQIEASRPLVELLVVACHWGKEYVSIPQSCSIHAFDNPRLIARLVIDHGADLVVGHHPHWVQGIEFYRGKLVAYSHGNLIFDQLWSVETQQGAIGRYTFFDARLVQVEFLPVFIGAEIQPRVLSVTEGAPILRRIEASSLVLDVDRPAHRPSASTRPAAP
jgi:UDP-N-acetylmuramoyl-L-alanyl-D-glutamate--2,6-diaminopimelate ligase